jgi:hypothetical protein
MKSDRENELSSILPDCVVVADCALHFVLLDCQYRAKPCLRSDNEMNRWAAQTSLVDCGQHHRF